MRFSSWSNRSPSSVTCTFWISLPTNQICHFGKVALVATEIRTEGRLWHRRVSCNGFTVRRARLLRTRSEIVSWLPGKSCGVAKKSPTNSPLIEAADVSAVLVVTAKDCMNIWMSRGLQFVACGLPWPASQNKATSFLTPPVTLR
jgi:hypothetical protein